MPFGSDERRGECDDGKDPTQRTHDWGSRWKGRWGRGPLLLHASMRDLYTPESRA